MLGLLTAMAGGLPFYARSKYFPENFNRIKGVFPLWSGVVLLVLSLVIFVWQMGVVKGLLTGFLMVTVAYSLLSFVFNLPKKYFLGFWVIMAFFLTLDILY